MNYYGFHTEDEQLVDELDSEFMVVTVLSRPDEGHNPGWELAIYDTRSKEEIRQVIRKLYNPAGRKA